MIPPYIDSLSHKIWQDTRMRTTAHHIHSAISSNTSNSKFVVFTHFPVMALAESLFREQEPLKLHTATSNDNYLRRALFDDIDLEINNPGL